MYRTRTAVRPLPTRGDLTEWPAKGHSRPRLKWHLNGLVGKGTARKAYDETSYTPLSQLGIAIFGLEPIAFYALFLRP